MKVNRLPPNVLTDTWLTPPSLLTALGKFDLDVCCPPDMPWQTANKMICQPDDGLAAEWKGRVWCNPPYSNPLAWVQRMAVHKNGIMLLPAKSPETRWGQAALKAATAILFQRGRMLFHYPDGTLSKGKWSPYMLLAFSEHDRDVLESVQHGDVTPGLVLVHA